MKLFRVLDDASRVSHAVEAGGAYRRVEGDILGKRLSVLRKLTETEASGASIITAPIQALLQPVLIYVVGKHHRVELANLVHVSLYHAG